MHPLNTIIIVLIFATTIFPQQSLIKNYTTVDGLPVSTIYDCVQASNGNMLFASEGGLIEYDGQTWVLHDSLGNLRANYPMHFINIDSLGTLWLFPKYSNNPVFYLRDEKWYTYGPISNKNHTILSYSINYENNSSEPDIIVATNNQNIFVHKSGEDQFKEISFNKIWQIHDVKFINNHLVLATNEGLYKYEYSANRLQTYIPDLKDPIYKIDKLSDEGRIYLLSEHWVGELKDDKVEIIIESFHLQFFTNNINLPVLRKIPNGKFYFGTKFQLMRYSPFDEHLQNFDEFEKRAIYGATSIFVDYEKNTWFTTHRGIVKLKYSPFVARVNPDELVEKEVTSISKFPNGKLVLGHNTGFSIFDEPNRDIQTIKLNPPTSDEFTRIMYSQYDEQNNLIWFISQMLGIGTIDSKNNIRWLIKNSELDRKNFMSFFINGQNKKFWASTNYLYEIDQNNSNKILLNTNSLIIRQITEYDENSLIIASKYGIFLYQLNKNKYKIIGHSERDKNDMYSVYNLEDNNWLVGTYGGLLLFNGEELSEFPKLKIDSPIFFIEKENDHIWFGLMGGALRWNPKTGEQRMFTTREGLAGVETNRDAFLFDDDRVYIGTENGLSIFIPQAYHAEYYKIKPKINFIGISDLDGNSSDITEDIEFSYTNNDLIIMYNSPSFIDETAMTYTVLLENIDDETTEIFNTNETSFYLRNLAPGEYKVGVSSINPNGVSSDTVYSNTIFIGSPFYTQSWFLTLLVLLSIAVSYSIYNYIVRSRYSNLLEEKVKIRTSQLQESEKNIRILTQRIFTAQEEQSEKIARDLHDHIAQDMAVLKLEVDKLIESNKSEHENYSWISDKISELTIYLRDLAYFLHANSIKQTGFVNSIHALCNDFNNHMKIDVEFFTNLEESFKISEESGNNIYRFIQEALWNVRKHSEANSALVILVSQDDSLIIRIEDDGKGFEVEEVLHSSNSRRMGLKSMEERILFLQGKFSIKSVIKDGTKIKAVIPLSVINQSASEANVDQASTS